MNNLPENTQTRPVLSTTVDAPPTQADAAGRQVTPVPEQTEGTGGRFDFSTLFIQGVNSEDIYTVSKQTGIPVTLPSYEEFAQENPDLGKSDAIALYNRIHKAYGVYEAGNFERGHGVISNLGKLPYTTAGEMAGWDMKPPPPLPNIYVSPESIAGPGFEADPIRLAKPDQIARSIGYFVNKDGELEKDKFFNRAFRFFEAVPHPDPNSPIPYYYQERGFTEKVKNEQMLRAVYGSSRLTTPWYAKAINVRAFLGGIAGTTFTGLGGYAQAAEVVTRSIASLITTGKYFEEHEAGENPLERKPLFLSPAINGLTNLGSYFTSTNIDEDERMFNNVSAFSNTVYNGMGQLTSMMLAGRLARGAKLGPTAAERIALGLGAAQGAAFTQQAALESGARPEDAAHMFFAAFGTIYATNLFLGANLAQRGGIKNLLPVLKKTNEELSKQVLKSTGSKIANLAPQTQNKLTSMVVGESFKKVLKSPKVLSDALEALSEKTLTIKGIKIPWGYQLAMGIEESIEESLEDLFMILPETLYNRHLALPRARQVQEYFNRFRYEIEPDPFGLNQYVKYKDDGTRIVLPYNVWVAEQEDLKNANSIIDGTRPFDAKFNIDEPMAAFFSSLLGGGGVYYIGGAHKAREYNDRKIYRQQMALEISRKGTKGRTDAIKRLRKLMQDEQNETGLFGPDFITPDGSIVSPEQKGEKDISVAGQVIETFINDILLDIKNIDKYGLNHPAIIDSTRGNSLLLQEALDLIEDIKSVEESLRKYDQTKAFEETQFVKPDSKVEDVQKTLGLLKERYRYITEPKDGPGGKQKSKRYSALYMSSMFKEFVVTLKARQNVDEKLKKEERVLDSESEEYLSLVKRESKAIMDDPQQMYMLTTFNDSSKILSAFQEHGTSDIYSFLDFVYNRRIREEMEAIKNERNEVISESQARFQNLEQHLSEIEARARTFKAPEWTKFQGKSITAEQRGELNAMLSEIQRIKESIGTLSNIGTYNRLLEEDAARLTSAFEQLSQILKPVEASATGIMKYVENVIQNKKVHEGSFEPSEELSSFLEEYQPASEELIGLLGQPLRMQRDVAIGDLTKEDPELVSEIRKEAALRFFNNINSSGIPDNQVRNMVPFSQQLNNWKLIVSNPQAQISEPEKIIDVVTQMRSAMLSFLEAIEANAYFLPSLPAEDAEHSMLNDGKSEHLKFTENEYRDIEAQVKSMVKDIDEILLSDALKSVSRDVEQMRYRINDLSLRNYLLGEVFTNVDKDKIPEFVKLYDELGKKIGSKDAMAYFQGLFKKYNNLTGTQKEIEKAKSEVVKAATEIEKLILAAEESLSGKLDDFIKQVLKGFNYSRMMEFGFEGVIQRKGTEIKGNLTPEYLSLVSDDIAVTHTRAFYLSTRANIINRLGRKNDQGVPTHTISEIYQAYRNVVEKRNTLRTEERDGKKVESILNPFHIATYEQEQLMLHIISWLLSPDGSNLHSSEVFKNLLQKSLYVRGFGGSGKSTIVLTDWIAVYEEITGKSLNVTLVVPTSHVEKIHLENFNKLYKSNFQIIRSYDIISNDKIPTGDVIIVDEAGVFATDVLKKLQPAMKETPVVWIGDDAQVPPTGEDSSLDLPIKVLCAERTTPITEVWRSGISMHFDVQDYFRTIASGLYTVDIPLLNYEFEKNTGLLRGGRYYANKGAVRDAFIDQYNRLPESERTIENILYIVPMDSDIAEVVDEFTKKYGAEKAALLEKHIFTVRYIATEKDHNKLVSGLTTGRVFFEFDPEEYVNRPSVTKPGYGHISLKGGAIGLHIAASIGRIGLTGSTRSTQFLGIIGDTKRSSEGRVFSTKAKVVDLTTLEQKDDLMHRLKLLTDNQTTYKKPRNGGDKPPRNVEKFNRSVYIDDEEKNRIANTPEFIALKQKLTTDNKKAISESQNNIRHATSLVMETDSVVKSKDSKKDKDFAKKSSIRALYFSNVLRFVLTGDDIYQTAALENIEQLNDHYKEVYAKDAKRLEELLIVNPGAFFATSLLTVQQRFNNIIKDPLSIFSGSFFVKDISVKNANGSITTTNIGGNPAIIKVIGYDQDGTPVVDIEDFVFHDYEQSVNISDPGPYSKNKMAMYVALAKLNGMVVNRIGLTHYLKNAAGVVYLGHSIVSDSDIISGLNEIKEVSFINNEIWTREEPELATEEQVFHNEKVVNDVVFMPNFYYVNDENGVVAIVDRVVRTSKGDGVFDERVYYFEKDDTVNIKFLSKVEFAKNFIPIKESETYKEDLRHEQRALNFVNGTKHNKIEGAIMSHSIAFPITEAFSGMVFDDALTTPYYLARNRVIQKVVNTIEAPVTQSYKATMDGYEIDSQSRRLVKKTFRHVVVNEIPTSWLLQKENLKEIVIPALIEADIIPKKHKLSNERLIELFVENRFNVLGYQNDPEYRFGAQAGQDISLVPFLDKFLNATDENDVMSSFMELKGMIEKGFQNDRRFDALLEFNLHKLALIKHLKDNGPITSTLADVEIGNVVTSESKLSGTQFIEKMNKKGFTTGEIQMIDVSDTFGSRTFFELDVTRDGFPGKRVITFDAKAAGLDDINKVIDELNELYTKNPSFKELLNEIRKLKDDRPTGLTYSKDEKNRLVAMHKAAMRMIEHSSAFQFLRANRSAMVRIYREIESEAKKKTTTIDGKKVKPLGVLFEFDSKRRLWIVGDSAFSKYINLQSILRALADYYKDSITTGKSDVVLRKNPFSLDYDLGGTLSNEARSIVNYDNVETNTSDIKTPELYIKVNEAVVDIPGAMQSFYNKGVANTTDVDFSDQSANDGADVPYKLKKPGVVDFDTISVDEAVREVNSIIGEHNASGRINIIPVTVENHAQHAFFGRLVNDVIELSGFETMAGQRVEKATPRHESMHFVMKHLLRQGELSTVLEDIKKELGAGWDGTIRHLYEHAAEKFEFIKIQRKPKNRFREFLFFLKKVANRFHLYRMSFNEMLLAADDGHYATRNFFSHPNNKIGTLYKEREENKFKNQDKLQEFKNKFGSNLLYNYYRDYLVSYHIRHFLDTGKSLQSLSGTTAEALWKTFNLYKNTARKMNLGDIDVTVKGGVVVKIKDMTGEQFLQLRINEGEVYSKSEVSKLMRHYAMYQFSMRDGFFFTAQDILPNSNIPNVIHAGREQRFGLVDPNKLSPSAWSASARKRFAERKEKVEGSKTTSKYADSESVDVNEFFNDKLNLVLNTIPLYTRSKATGLFEIVPNQYLNKNHVLKIFRDSFTRLAKTRTLFDISFEDLLNEVRNYGDAVLSKGYVKDVHNSIWLEFGDSEVMVRERETENPLFYNSDGILKGVGNLAIIKNPERYNQVIKFQPTDFKKKVTALRNLHSGLLSRFMSESLVRMASVDVQAKKINVKNNVDQSLVKYNLNEVMYAKTVDKNTGLIFDRIGEYLNYPDSGSVKVTVDGFGIVDYSEDEFGKSRFKEFFRKTNLSTLSLFDIESIASTIGLPGLNARVIAEMLELQRNEERIGKTPVGLLNTLHVYLASLKVNYNISKNIQQYVDLKLDEFDRKKGEYIDANKQDPSKPVPTDEQIWKTIDTADVESNAIKFLSDEDKALFDYLKNTFYQGEDAVTKGKFSMEMSYSYPWGGSYLLPFPTDFYTYTQAIAEKIVMSRLQEPVILLNPEGEPVYSRTPAAMISEAEYGSGLFVSAKRDELIPAVKDGLVTPLVTKVKDKDDEFNFHNGLLNYSMLFDQPYLFGGVENELRGVNFKNMTQADMMTVIIREFFAHSLINKRSSNKVNVLLPPFADKGRAFILPALFPKPGTHSKEFDAIFDYKRNSRNEIVDVTVNESLFVRLFKDLIEYYHNRRNKSINDLARVIGKTPEDLLNGINKNEPLLVDEKVRNEIKYQLVSMRDYIISDKPNAEGFYLVQPGMAITQENVVLNEAFMAKWDAAKSESEKYLILKDSVKDDFISFTEDLEGLGVIGRISEDKFLGPYFLSNFTGIELKSIAEGSVDPAKINEHIRNQIKDILKDWFNRNNYSKTGERISGDAGLGSMELDDYYALKKSNPDAAKAIAKAMMNDDPLSKSLNKIKAKGKRTQKKYTAESLKDTKNQKWSPALEALYFVYWYSGETFAHLTRGDATIFSSPSEYIKKGAGYIAPGTFFDTHNPEGIGKNANVLVVDDLPGFYTFLGVEKGSSAGKALFTDGFSLLNPVFAELLKRSAGADYGNVSDYANKTVLYGKDLKTDNDFYFKFSQLKPDAVHFKNSSYYQKMFDAMFGNHYKKFIDFLNQTNNFDDAVSLMADYAVDPKNATNGVLPRDEMVSYVIHPSSFKNGLKGINSFKFDENQISSPLAANLAGPVRTIQVPNKFLRLQTVNHGDGEASMRSFATQMFSTLGVKQNNLIYQERFNNALNKKVEVFNNKLQTVIETGDKEKALAFLKNKALAVAGKGIKGTKMERLLKNSEIVGEAFSHKLFDSLISYFNDHLKPDVIGNTMVQEAEKMALYFDKNGVAYLPQDIGLNNDSQDHPMYTRRMLNPLSYMNPATGQIYKTKEDLIKDVKANVKVVTIPAEVVAKFHYAKKFGIWSGATLQEVFGLKNGETLYESAQERAMNKGAKDVDDFIQKMIAKTAVGEDKVQAKNLLDLFLQLNSPIMVEKFTKSIRAHARKDIKDILADDAISDDEKDRLFKIKVGEYLAKSFYDEKNNFVSNPVLDYIGRYYYSLNNAMDLMFVRIPTTNASSGSVARLVAFSETGNTIFTSAEKSILDGSDYDHDELHVFYPSFLGLQKVTSAFERRSDKKINIQQMVSIENAYLENEMFSAIWDFYMNVQNSDLVLAPINIQSMRDYAQRKEEREFVINSVSHTMHSTTVNFAGVNLVGHFANQMTVTNRLLSRSFDELVAVLNPKIKLPLDPNENPDRVIHVYASILDLVAKFTNAAVDNAKENGLLGRMNITAPVTNLIMGKIFTFLPSDIVSIVENEDQAAIMDLGLDIEKHVLDFLQDEIIIRAADLVTRTSSIFYPGSRTKIWDAIQTASDEEISKIRRGNWVVVDVIKDGVVKKERQISDLGLLEILKVKNFTERALDAAYFGEQAQRLGTIYGLTQGLSGEKADYIRDVFNIEKALGQKLNDFLKENNLAAIRDVDYSDPEQLNSDVSRQVKEVMESHVKWKKVTAKDRIAETAIRGMINIPRIVANNPLIIEQLKGISNFNSLMQMVFFDEANPQIKQEILKRTGNPELLYEDGFKSYELAIKKALIGKFADVAAPKNITLSMDMDRMPVEVSYDLTKSDQRFDFVLNFYDHVTQWKRMLPNVAFLQNIDFENVGFLSVPIAKFTNSIYLDPFEKAAFESEFKNLARTNSDIADAIRYYNLFVYGFSHRNGSFIEVIDDKMEVLFSSKFNTVSKLVSEQATVEKENATSLFDFIVLNSTELIPQEAKDKKYYYKRVPRGYSYPSVFKFLPSSDDQAKEELYNRGSDNHVLINLIHPKELFISSFDKAVTYSFVYRGLNKQKLQEIKKNNSITLNSSRWIGVTQNPVINPSDLLNIPYSGASGFIENGMYVEFALDNDRKLNITKPELPFKSLIYKPASKIDRLMGSHAASALFTVLQKAFPSIKIDLVNSANAMTDGIGYFYNGEVKINADKIQADTPIHELTHALLLVLKKFRKAQYNLLRDNAIQMISQNDPVALSVIETYPHLAGDDLLDEIISTFVGFKSEGMVMDFLATHFDPDPITHGKTFWQKVKGFISNFWSSMKAYFRGYAISIDPEISTLKDFATEVVNKALKGERVFELGNSELLSLALASSDQIYEQKDSKRETTYELYDLLMNSGSYDVGGETRTIKQYRDLDRRERIDDFKKRLPNMGYVYQTYKGEDVRFDVRKPETWDALIEEKVLSDFDEFGTEMKETILKAINDEGAVLQNIIDAFGNDEYDRPRFEKHTIQKLLNNMRYHPNNKYILYTDLLKTDYAYLYDESLVGINPIVSIEYDKDDQVIISLFQITRDFIKKRDKLSPVESRNILARFIANDHNAGKKQITLQSNVGDVSNLTMALAASNMVKSNKKVKISAVGTISLFRVGTTMALADGVELTQNIEAMLKVPEFVDNITPALKKRLEEFKLIHNAFNLEEVLFNKFGELDDFNEATDQQKKGALNVNEKIIVYNKRLRQIYAKGNELTTADAVEVEMLLEGLGMLYNPNILNEHKNTRKDIGKFAKLISPQFDVGHEILDVIRRATLNVSQKNVRMLQEFKDKNNDFADFFQKRFEMSRGAAKKFLHDTTYQHFDEILASVKDQNGIDRLAGFVLWTTDKELDPLFYEQARNVDPELLKWGKYVVDTITEQMIENFYHYRLRNYGDFAKKNNILVDYTREMAAEDLFTKTTYKRGMIPLMPETVGSLLSQGKLGVAFRKRKRQIESTYVQFEEMSELTDEQNDAFDQLPDTFMNQFVLKQSERVGSLGLAHERMYTMLGLTEVEGKYIYDKNTDRNRSFNTDLETLLEFFKMSSVRKINYENEVLPMLNGAMLYLHDLQNSKDFAQENVMEYLELFHRQAILNRRVKENFEVGGLSVDSLVMMATSYASPLVMTLNLNVGAVSATHNFFMAFIEGVTNDIYDLLSPEEKTHWPSTKDFMKASTLFFTDFHKVTQILREFQLVNASEYETITHRWNQKRKKHIVSDFYGQITNWGTDFYARGVVTVAQMLKDGSYYAYQYKEDTGKISYNSKQDRMYYQEDGNQTEKQKLLWDLHLKNMESQGWGMSAENKPLYGYDGRQMRSFKAYADKYIVGAYGQLEKNLLSQFLIGRMFMMFTTWFMTKVSMAVKKGSYIDEIGYYDIVKDSQGNHVPKWMREWSEGYFLTIGRMTINLLTKGDVKQFQKMNPTEKKNWIRGSVTLMLFLMNWLLYGALVGRGEDEDKVIPDSRLVRNWLFAYSSLLVIPGIIEKANSPFAVTGIIKRAWEQGLTVFEGDYWNLRHVFPVVGAAYTMSDFIESFNR